MIWGGIIRLQLYILYVSKAIYLTEITYLLFHWYSIKSMTKKKKTNEKTHTQVSGKGDRSSSYLVSFFFLALESQLQSWLSN